MNLKHLVLYLFLFFFSTNIKAQCPTEDWLITSQVELDSFKIKYPACTDLDIQIYLSATSIVDLSPLDGLKSLTALSIYNCLELTEAKINEDLQITRLNIGACEKLEHANVINNVAPNGIVNLQDLQSLSPTDIYDLEVLENFWIRNLPFETLNNFPNLTAINGYLRIYNNPNLADISVLNDVDLNDVHINLNPNLESCALDAICDVIFEDVNKVFIEDNGPECTYLQQVIEACHPDTVICYLKELEVNGQGDLDILSIFPDQCIDSITSIMIFPNGIEPISDLSNLIRFKTLDVLKIHSVQQLTSLVGLDSLFSVRDFELYNNKNLESLEGLGNLKSIEGIFKIDFNDNLSAISSEHLNLEKLEGLHISNTPIADLSALANIEYISDLSLFHTEIVNMDWAQTIAFTDKVLINNNLLLENIILDNSENAIVDCEIKDNSKLNIIDGLTFRDTAQDIRIQQNPLTTLQNTKGPKVCEEFISIANTDLKNIAAWEGLENVRNLSIVGNDQLESTEILSNLKEIGNLTFSNNPKLISLGSIPTDNNLHIENLKIQSNDSLQNINILDNDGSIDDISIRNNQLLSECDILPICKEYKSTYPDIRLDGNSGNCNLVDLNFDCDWGHNAYGDIIIKSQYDFDSVTSLFPLMDSVNGSLILDFSSNSDDIDFSFFENINFIRDRLEIRHPKEDNVFEIFEGITVGGLLLTNLETSTLDILNYADELTQFRLTDIQGLTDFAGLENVTDINGKIDIVGTSILSTDGLDNLENINEIQFVDCPLLTNINSLANVDYIRDLRLAVLPEFIDFEIFDGMTLPRSLQFNELPHLTDFPEFVQNTTIETFSISRCQGLFNLQLDSVIIAHTWFSIFGNHNLESVSFESLEQAKNFSVVDNHKINDIHLPRMNIVTATFHIASNDELEHLDGINQTLLANELKLRQNPMLVDCNMELICNNFSAGSNLNIEENLGCETAEAITDLCAVSVYEEGETFDFKVFPNPARTTLHIEGSYDLESMKLYNTIGQQYQIEIISNTIDVSSLESGLYYLRATKENTARVIGFVKE